MIYFFVFNRSLCNQACICYPLRLKNYKEDLKMVTMLGMYSIVDEVTLLIHKQKSH